MNLAERGVPAAPAPPKGSVPGSSRFPSFLPRIPRQRSVSWRWQPGRNHGLGQPAVLVGTRGGRNQGDRDQRDAAARLRQDRSPKAAPSLIVVAPVSHITGPLHDTSSQGARMAARHPAQGVMAELTGSSQRVPPCCDSFARGVMLGSDVQGPSFAHAQPRGFSHRAQTLWHQCILTHVLCCTPPHSSSLQLLLPRLQRGWG